MFFLLKIATVCYHEISQTINDFSNFLNTIYVKKKNTL